MPRIHTVPPGFMARAMARKTSSYDPMPAPVSPERLRAMEEAARRHAEGQAGYRALQILKRAATRHNMAIPNVKTF